MNFIKNLFNYSENFSGLLFENNKIIIIKIKKESNNHTPLYWDIIDFDLDNPMEKSDMVLLFKKIRSKIKSNKINLQVDGDTDIYQKIYSNLKIAGFQEIHQKNWEDNIENIVINKNILEKNIFIFLPSPQELKIYYVKEGYIYKKENYTWGDFNQKTIDNVFSDIDHKHVFISGDFHSSRDKLENIFYDARIKVHVFNLWTNILSFKKFIPPLFKQESHVYIKAISLAIPKLKEIKFEEEGIQEDIIIKKKEKTEEDLIEEFNVDFIVKDKKEAVVLKESKTILQSIKDFFNTPIFTSPQKHFDKKLSSPKKRFLPKPKKKLFLPLWKKKVENKDKKEKRREGKRNKKKEKQSENKAKVFLKKPVGKIFLPIPSTEKYRKMWKKIIKFFNQSVLESKNKK